MCVKVSMHKVRKISLFSFFTFNWFRAVRCEKCGRVPAAYDGGANEDSEGHESWGGFDTSGDESHGLVVQKGERGRRRSRSKELKVESEELKWLRGLLFTAYSVEINFKICNNFNEKTLFLQEKQHWTLQFTIHTETAAIVKSWLFLYIIICFWQNFVKVAN